MQNLGSMDFFGAHKIKEKCDQSRKILKSVYFSNKGTQLQTKCGISDGALRVTYYGSWGFVSCNLIFHVVT